MEREISAALLYQVGKGLLGSKADELDEKVVQAVGLLSAMGNAYAVEKGIECDNVITDYRSLTVSFMQGDRVIDSFTVTRQDIATPQKWHNRLLKQCGKEIPKD
jgi:hypothetical protein